MAIEVGQVAPAFTLYDTTRTKVSLSDFKGKKILLLFFPQAFSRVCTKELCSVRDNIGMYNTVVGISVDSVFTLAKYKEVQEYSFPLLSDFNKQVSALYGCLYDIWILEMHGVSKRSAFIIDKSGIVKYAEVLENAGDEPNYDQIQKILGCLD